MKVKEILKALEKFDPESDILCHIEELSEVYKNADVFNIKDINKVEKESPQNKREQHKTPDTLVACADVGDEPVKMTSAQERTLLADLPEWEIVETKGTDGKMKRELHRSYKFESFELAFQFMKVAVEDIISELNHHPRWENTYNRVNIWLTTSDLNGELSNRDECMTRNLEALSKKISGGSGKK